MLTLALRRKRVPIGGAFRSVELPSVCLAGQTQVLRIVGAVNLSACPITPEAISSYRTRPGKIGNPAASAEVQPSGRNALELRFQTAPASPSQLPSACGLAWKTSYNMQVPLFTTSTWRSVLSFCSIGALVGIGYGPGSLWSSYRNVIGTRGWVPGTEM